MAIQPFGPAGMKRAALLLVATFLLAGCFGSPSQPSSAPTTAGPTGSASSPVVNDATDVSATYAAAGAIGDAAAGTQFVRINPFGYTNPLR
jgi:hypothetical protein